MLYSHILKNFIMTFLENDVFILNWFIKCLNVCQRCLSFPLFDANVFYSFYKNKQILTFTLTVPHIPTRALNICFSRLHLFISC